MESSTESEMADPMALMTEVKMVDLMEYQMGYQMEDRSASMTEVKMVDPMEYQMEDHLAQTKEPG